MKYFGFIGFWLAIAGLVAAVKGNAAAALSLAIIGLAFIAFSKR